MLPRKVESSFEFLSSFGKAFYISLFSVEIGPFSVIQFKNPRNIKLCIFHTATVVIKTFLLFFLTFRVIFGNLHVSHLMLSATLIGGLSFLICCNAFFLLHTDAFCRVTNAAFRQARLTGNPSGITNRVPYYAYHFRNFLQLNFWKSVLSTENKEECCRA